MTLQEKREVNPELRNTVCINGNCKPNKKTEKINQKNKATNIAQKAAQEAKAASEAQQDAGQQAAHQVTELYYICHIPNYWWTFTSLFIC